MDTIPPQCSKVWSLPDKSNSRHGRAAHGCLIHKNCPLLRNSSRFWWCLGHFQCGTKENLQRADGAESSTARSLSRESLNGIRELWNYYGIMEWNFFLAHWFSSLLILLPAFPSGGDKTTSLGRLDLFCCTLPQIQLKLTKKKIKNP